MEKCKNDSKLFARRESILTELLKKDSKTKLIYYLWCALLAIWFAYVIGEYITDPSVFDYDVQCWNLAFRTWHVAILTWIIQHVTVLLVFFPVTLIRLYLLSLRPKLIASKSFNRVFAVLYVSYVIAFFIMSNRLVAQYRVSTVWKIAIKFETLRLVMKMHSFAIETNKIYQSLDNKSDGNDSRAHTVYRKLSQFLYFLIVPTLIYANQYPKSERIRWSFVFWQLIHFILMNLLLTFTLFNRFFPAFVSTVGTKPLDFGDILRILVIGYPVAVCVVICKFSFTHCWYNLFAEITRFGDRQFYGEWWTSYSLREWLRQWHSVVQHWFYYYIAKPINQITGNKLMGNYAVMILTGVGHEYIISALGFSIMYSSGYLLATPIIMSTVITYSAQNRGPVLRNIRTVALLSFNYEIMLLIMSIEWYSRINCPNHSNGLLDFFVPRFPFCVSIIY